MIIHFFKFIALTSSFIKKNGIKYKLHVYTFNSYNFFIVYDRTYIIITSDVVSTLHIDRCSKRLMFNIKLGINKFSLFVFIFNPFLINFTASQNDYFGTFHTQTQV